MKLTYIEGPDLGKALVSGSFQVMNNVESLNEINVFPVPDGDTGTNMASTVQTISAAFAEGIPDNVSQVLDVAAASALEGARGNSGAIFAQFFHGLAKELRNEARVSMRRFSEAALKASEHAQKALSHPKDGTILSVIRDWALQLQAHAEKSSDVTEVMDSALAKARLSLEETRNILPEMRDAQVVDAGAKGFVHFLEGVLDYMKTGVLKSFKAQSSRKIAGQAIHTAHDSTEQGRYCTEVLLQGEGIDAEALKAFLEEHGNSVVVAGSDTRARIHVHTDYPSVIFDYLETKGELSGHKIDDMLLQVRLSGIKKRQCAIVVDSACDISDEFRLEHGIIRVPLTLIANGRPRPDGEGYSASALRDRMRTDPTLVMTTSQPSDAVFKRAFELALSSAEKVLYIGLASTLSGTFEAGLRASREFPGRVVCVDSRELTAGYGLLVTRAVRAAEAGKSAEDTARLVEQWRRKLALFVAVPDLTSLERTGRLGGVKGLVLKKFGLRPVITPGPDGKAESGGLYLGIRKGPEKLFRLVRKQFGKDEKLEIQIVHVDNPSAARQLADMLEQYFTLSRPIVISQMGPLLSSLAWLGSVGVAALPESEELSAASAEGGKA